MNERVTLVICHSYTIGKHPATHFMGKYLMCIHLMDPSVLGTIPNILPKEKAEKQMEFHFVFS